MTSYAPFSCRLRVGLIVLSLFVTIVGHAQETDQALDDESSPSQTQKQDSGDRYRILPIPIFITEPAVGQGLGLALTLFHPVKDSTEEPPGAATPNSIANAEGAGNAPPVATAYTENETWAAGVGHTNHWRNDSIRYSGVAAIAQINSELYLLNRPLEFSLDAAIVYQDLKFRLKRSNVFLGAKLCLQSAANQSPTKFPV
jgi:hypothetical protein